MGVDWAQPSYTKQSVILQNERTRKQAELDAQDARDQANDLLVQNGNLVVSIRMCLLLKRQHFHRHQSANVKVNSPHCTPILMRPCASCVHQRKMLRRQ